MGKKKIKKIRLYRDKVLKNREKFFEAAEGCKFKTKEIEGLGCICKLEDRWTVTCDPEHCPL